VAQWLQFGTVNSDLLLLKRLSTALGLIIVDAKNRLVSNKFSLVNSIRTWRISFKRLLHILFGLPEMRTVSFNMEMLTEEQMFLTEELVVDV
jgi:hypothetical protein